MIKSLICVCCDNFLIPPHCGFLSGSTTIKVFKISIQGSCISMFLQFHEIDTFELIKTGLCPCFIDWRWWCVRSIRLTFVWCTLICWAAGIDLGIKTLTERRNAFRDRIQKGFASGRVIVIIKSLHPILRLLSTTPLDKKLPLLFRVDVCKLMGFPPDLNVLWGFDHPPVFSCHDASIVS